MIDPPKIGSRRLGPVPALSLLVVDHCNVKGATCTNIDMPIDVYPDAFWEMVRLLSFVVIDDDTMATISASWAYHHMTDLVSAGTPLSMTWQAIGLPSNTSDTVLFPNVSHMFYDIQGMYDAVAMAGQERAGSDQAERRMQLDVAIRRMLQFVSTDDLTLSFSLSGLS